MCSKVVEGVDVAPAAASFLHSHSLYYYSMYHAMVIDLRRVIALKESICCQYTV